MSDSRSRNGMTMSPLVLSHHLLALAEDADRAGLRRSAEHLVDLAHRVCDDKPRSVRRRMAALLPTGLLPGAPLPANVTRLPTANAA